MLASLPPITIVGSRPPWARSVETIEVVVVFPWLPETAMENFILSSSASISARGMTGMSRSWAASTSGLSGRTAVEMTTTSALPIWAASWPWWMRGAQVVQTLGDVGDGEVRAADLSSPD